MCVQHGRCSISAPYHMSPYYPPDLEGSREKQSLGPERAAAWRGLPDRSCGHRDAARPGCAGREEVEEIIPFPRSPPSDLLWVLPCGLSNLEDRE